MAYIAPNSTVEFFGDLGLDPGYENTKYFASTAAKDNYFSGLTAIATCTAMSYNRQERGFFRVEKTMSELIGAGYCRYKNTGFENKWFYAFIDHIEYVNNVTTEVHFIPDVLMTWQGTYTLGQCYIERQHSTTDVIGDNIMEENVQLGDMVCNGVETTGLFSTYNILICATVDSQGESDYGFSNVNNLYSGVNFHQFGTVEAATAFINDLTNADKITAVLGCVMCPNFMIVDQQDHTAVKNIVGNLTTLDGYTPVNKKLYTYPYNYLQVTNGMGNFASFRYEFFPVPAVPGFNIYGIASLNPEVFLMPMGYKNLPLNQDDIREKLSMTGFPSVAYNVDSYKAFIAQYGTVLATDMIGSAATGALSVATGLMTGNILGAIQSGASVAQQVAHTVAEVREYQQRPPQAQGSQGSDLQTALRIKDFYFYKLSVDRQHAKMIDDYFTMFGYAQRKVATPNCNARPKFTYVQTIGCIVHGNLPADDARQIESIFDKGVRFWAAAANIGDFSGNILS